MTNFITNGTFDTNTDGWIPTDYCVLTSTTPPFAVPENGNAMYLSMPEPHTNIRAAYQNITGLTDTSKDVEVSFWAFGPLPIVIYIQNNVWWEEVVAPDFGSVRTVIIPAEQLPITQIKFECIGNYYIDNISMDYKPDPINFLKILSDDIYLADKATIEYRSPWITKPLKYWDGSDWIQTPH